MSKGDETRQRVLDQAGGLLNQRGYLSTPLSAILDTVGLQKGGLYNHFESKEDLALQAFCANVQKIAQYFERIVKTNADAKKLLIALIDASLNVSAGLIVPGGCPILNAGAESDDAWELLRQETAKAAERLRNYFLIPLKNLSHQGRLKSGTSIEDLSYFIWASLEGAILHTKISRSNEGQKKAISILKSYLDSCIV